MWLLQLINKSPLTDINNALVEVIKDAQIKFDAKNEGEYPKGGIGVSTLRPYHVEGNSLPHTSSYNTWSTTIGTAYTWEDWINLTVDDDLYILPTGLFNRTLSPAVTEIWGKADGRDMAVQNIEQLYAWEMPFGYFSKPFQVGPSKAFEMEIYGSRAQEEFIGLLGFAIARTNVLIDKS